MSASIGDVFGARVTVALVAWAALAAPAVAAGPERPMGRVFDWSHELTQRRLPAWRDTQAPVIRPARWYQIVNGLMLRAGENGLWFSGYNALPFDVPAHPKDPTRWRRAAVLAREYRTTGLSWDVNLEARAADIALNRRWAAVFDASSRAPTRRLSLLDPGYERATAAEIRRLVPRYAALPYVHAYTGSDEPIAVLPRGRAALATPFAKRLRARVRSGYGWAPPSAGAKPTSSVVEGLRWLAYSRYTSDRFFAMKKRQAALIRSLDSDAVIVPNDYMFIEAFMPWDYTRLAGFADIVEADPYMSLAERARPGRGRYNHGFGAKFLSDLAGTRVRIIVQAFPYAGYTPTPDDLETWTAQALRAGASDISFYASQNPRFTDRPLYTRMLTIARRLRGATLPGRPVDPASVVVYATASEGQARPHLTGDNRYRTSGDELYSTYALLGEHGHAAFTFDSDARLIREPGRLDRARMVWLPRAETLDRGFADQLVAWVQAGGTLVVTDPDSFRRTPHGASLTDVRATLIGAEPSVPTSGPFTVRAGTLGSAGPAVDLTFRVAAPARAFSAVPSGGAVIATSPAGAPVVVERPVGAGRVVAFATDVMEPGNVIAPGDLVPFIETLHRAGGGATDDPAWTYRLPTP